MTKTTMPTIGIDLGDDYSCFCILSSEESDPTDRGRIKMTVAAMQRFLEQQPSSLVVIEAGMVPPPFQAFDTVIMLMAGYMRDVPRGAGLASSAAITVAMAEAPILTTLLPIKMVISIRVGWRFK